ncbi:MAG: hypothetical protein HY923_04410 [Elusimicrobia bacterium]|nr:hypothetical protein [Elusimicrobiota bacterium]
MTAKHAHPPAHAHAHAHTRGHGRRLFEGFFAFGVCVVLYALVMVGSVWAPLFLGGAKIKPLVAFVLMPMDLMMLGWNQPWYILLFHLGTTGAAFALSKAGTEKQFKLMLIAFATCALVSAVNDAIKAYRVLRHPPK